MSWFSRIDFDQTSAVAPLIGFEGKGARIRNHTQGDQLHLFVDWASYAGRALGLFVFGPILTLVLLMRWENFGAFAPILLLIIPLSLLAWIGLVRLMINLTKRRPTLCFDRNHQRVKLFLGTEGHTAFDIAWEEVHTLTLQTHTAKEGKRHEIENWTLYAHSHDEEEAPLALITSDIQETMEQLHSQINEWMKPEQDQN